MYQLWVMACWWQGVAFFGFATSSTPPPIHSPFVSSIFSLFIQSPLQLFLFPSTISHRQSRFSLRLAGRPYIHSLALYRKKFVPCRVSICCSLHTHRLFFFFCALERTSSERTKRRTEKRKKPLSVADKQPLRSPSSTATFIFIDANNRLTISTTFL